MLQNFKAAFGTMLGVGAGLALIGYISDKLGIKACDKCKNEKPE